jgi:hypothetical protein
VLLHFHFLNLLMNRLIEAICGCLLNH